MRYFKITDNSPTEGSLSGWLPNTSNPTLLTPTELLALGIHTLQQPAAIEGSRWIPVAPTVVGGSLVGGWVSEVIPEPEPVPDWQGWQIAQLEDPTWVAFCQTIPIAMTTALTTLVSQVSNQPETVHSIAAVWAGIAAMVPPGSEAKAVWVARAESFNLPAAFVAAFAL